jgi:hypothetical protein
VTMRFLADENFPGDAVTALRTAGHDLAWIRTDAPVVLIQMSWRERWRKADQRPPT